MNQEIKKLQRLSIFLSVIGVITFALALGLFIIALASTILNGVNKDTKQQAVIDSLEMEIQLRDNLINHTKDTTYGEEKTN